MIRVATLDDLPFMLGVARARYPAFDEPGAREWGELMLRTPDVLILRGDYGFGVSALKRFFYEPSKPHAKLLFLAALPNRKREGFRLLQMMAQWALAQGASFTFGAETGIDFAPLAKRLGAVKTDPVYVIEASHDHQENH